MQLRQELMPFVRNAIAIAVPKENDPIGTGNGTSPLLLEVAKEPPSEAPVIVRTLWTVSLSDQHITVRQDVEPTGMLEVARKGVHDKASGCGRRGVCAPSDRRRDFDRWYQGVIGSGERRVCSDPRGYREMRIGAASPSNERERDRRGGAPG
jgi:hypothetical protein